MMLVLFLFALIYIQNCYSQPLLDCGLIQGKNVTVHASVFNETTTMAWQEYIYYYKNMTMIILDDKLNVIKTGTYELGIYIYIYIVYILCLYKVLVVLDISSGK